MPRWPHEFSQMAVSGVPGGCLEEMKEEEEEEEEEEELVGRGTYVLQAARTTHRYCRIFLAQEHWAVYSSGLYQLYKEKMEEEDIHGELV